MSRRGSALSLMDAMNMAELADDSELLSIDSSPEDLHSNDDEDDHSFAEDEEEYIDEEHGVLAPAPSSNTFSSEEILYAESKRRGLRASMTKTDAYLDPLYEEHDEDNNDNATSPSIPSNVVTEVGTHIDDGGNSNKASIINTSIVAKHPRSNSTNTFVSANFTDDEDFSQGAEASMSSLSEIFTATDGTRRASGVIRRPSDGTSVSVNSAPANIEKQKGSILRNASAHPLNPSPPNQRRRVTITAPPTTRAATYFDYYGYQDDSDNTSYGNNAYSNSLNNMSMSINSYNSSNFISDGSFNTAMSQSMTNNNEFRRVSQRRPQILVRSNSRFQEGSAFKRSAALLQMKELSAAGLTTSANGHNSASSSNFGGSTAKRHRKSGSTNGSNLTSSSGASRKLTRMFGLGSSKRMSHGKTNSNDGSSASSKRNLGVTMDLVAAAQNLDTTGANANEWENVAAAAAVVAASQTPVTRSNVQFSKGDYALVVLSLLNSTNHDFHSQHSFTINPVNCYGYPRGKGGTDQERRGPYSFVLCTVVNVHFDEDERYYTVKRADSGSEQRSEPAWMVAINSTEGLEAAQLAAEYTKATAALFELEHQQQEGFWHSLTLCFSNVLHFPTRLLFDNLIPCFLQSRLAAKMLIRHLMHGDPGFGLKIRLTAVNLIVICSIIYLFIDVVQLAFLSADYDYGIAVLSFIVWGILVLELLFELLIRDPDYYMITKSKQAFAPRTARYINRYHLICESIALLLFIPQFYCLFGGSCGRSIPFGALQATLDAISSKVIWESILGRIILGLHVLRMYGLLRHWKQMWLTFAMEGPNTESRLFRKLLLVETERGGRGSAISQKKDDKNDLSYNADSGNTQDLQLTNAANIGAALMLINSHRGLFLLLVIVIILPSLITIGGANAVIENSVELLQSINLLANSTESCSYLEVSVASWLQALTLIHNPERGHHIDEEHVGVVWAQLLPVRCEWQLPTGVITTCDSTRGYAEAACIVWDSLPDNTTYASKEYFANVINTREGSIVSFTENAVKLADFGQNQTFQEFSVKVMASKSANIAQTNTTLFLLLLSMFLLMLAGLTTMRRDSKRLVLDPLQRMLRIVVKYAENPLSNKLSTKSQSLDEEESNTRKTSRSELGTFETEQLINAVAKIADLLRKCWGVAGAGIISSNLARTRNGKTVVFNPTVPGKRVYALFGFVAMSGFDKLLRALDRDVMIIINDVARVVHDEVYRWALGDSGQCNKNLGGAFLMVFRIGDFSEVHDKKKRATDVVFSASQTKKRSKLRRRKSSHNKNKGDPDSYSSRHFDINRDGTLQLASLPGIQSFTDRALLGFLKSFAGMHRDKKLDEWKQDFRLSAGVGAFKVNIMYGMDAGWAVEGAVGSEYKIDATYLSPHVNMASRMMSATKQYGVTILVSQAVEELLSRFARSKLRQLDTVFVKGSSVEQRIYTYDARSQGVDFFLNALSPEQADSEAEAYSAVIWDNDQDLKSMRQHVTEEFSEKFSQGLVYYTRGDWPEAVEKLREADNMMIKAVLEEGYIDYDVEEFGSKIYDSNCTDYEVKRIRQELGDGASKSLIQYMTRRKCKPPPDWRGVRHLMSK